MAIAELEKATEQAPAATPVSPLIPLQCASQNYAWGRPAACSEVAALAGASGARVDKDQRYAELWMGTHPSGPSCLPGGQTLLDWVLNNPAALGEKVVARFGSDLPFLFKVLSVDTALSIQAHPDKALAHKLHTERPNVYKDENHKPEMAIAISDDFTALCSFVAPDKLKEALRNVPEITAVVGEDRVNAYLNCSTAGTQVELKMLYSQLMTACDQTVKQAVGALVARLGAAKASGQVLSKKEELVLHLNRDYPMDIGILSVFFLNLVELQAGQAMYLDANEPHAYLSGELVEIMATSDNVVRAGLTPKLKDVKVLVEMLTYSQGMPEILNGDEVRKYTRRYLPPVDEFQLECMDVPASTSASIPAVPSAGLVLVQQGSATFAAGDMKMAFKRGDVFFVPANTDVQLQTGDHTTKLWVANVSSRVWG